MVQRSHTFMLEERDSSKDSVERGPHGLKQDGGQ